MAGPVAQQFHKQKGPSGKSRVSNPHDARLEPGITGLLHQVMIADRNRATKLARHFTFRKM